MDCLCKIFSEFPIFDYHKGRKILDSKLIFDFTKGKYVHIKRNQQKRVLSGIGSCTNLDDAYPMRFMNKISIYIKFPISMVMTFFILNL